MPGKEIVQTARLVASARLADAQGDLAGAAKAYEAAIEVEDALAYMEPPYWYYPIRQSLGSIYLRQGKLDAAQELCAIRWAACVATAGRWRAWRRSTSARATRRPRPRRARLTRGPGSAARRPTSTGCRQPGGSLLGPTRRRKQ